MCLKINKSGQPAHPLYQKKILNILTIAEIKFTQYNSR